MAGPQYTNTAGIWFPDVSVPPMASVISAKVVYVADVRIAGRSDAPVQFKISAGASATEPPIGPYTDNITARAHTEAYALWTPGPSPAAMEPVPTVNFAGVVNEVVSRRGWRAGSPLLLIFDTLRGSGVRVVEADGAELTVEYAVPCGPLELVPGFAAQDYPYADWEPPAARPQVQFDYVYVAPETGASATMIAVVAIAAVAVGIAVLVVTMRRRAAPVAGAGGAVAFGLGLGGEPVSRQSSGYLSITDMVSPSARSRRLSSCRGPSPTDFVPVGRFGFSSDPMSPEYTDPGSSPEGSACDSPSYLDPASPEYNNVRGQELLSSPATAGGGGSDSEFGLDTDPSEPLPPPPNEEPAFMFYRK